MSNEETVVLACPYCQGDLERPLGWFRQPYFTCPGCGGGLAAGQFAPLVAELDAAFEASVALMVNGAPAAACGCAGGGCHKEES